MPDQDSSKPAAGRPDTASRQGVVAGVGNEPSHAAHAVPTHGPAMFGPQSLIAGIAVVTALYFGRDVFVPIALAVLLTFLLSPIVSLLRRWHIPRTVAVVSVVAMAMFAIFVFAVIVANQVTNLAGNLPSYQYNIQGKIRDIRESTMSGGSFDRAARMLEELEQEMLEAEEDAAAAEDAEPEPAPIPVRIEDSNLSPVAVLTGVVAPILAPLATGGIVIVFVIFMLLRREDLRDRFIRLAGASDMHRTTNALQDAGRRVGQYLLMQLVVNVTYAVPMALGLWLIGVPNAMLWGLLCLVLRFVPYVGPVIAAFFPLALSIAVDPGWTMLLWTAALILTLELISNNFIEPWLYGSRTGLSPVAIILAAIFWTWLWGPIGLLLSTPLTVCFVVLGRHVPQFEFLDILLGNEPVLSPHERLYQRLLAGDPDEATEQAETYLETKRMVDFYDNVAIPALVLVERDRSRGVLDDLQRETVASGAVELVENLDEHDDSELELSEEERDALADREARLREELPAVDLRDGAVVCAGARGNLDDAAAVMLADALAHRHVAATTLPHEMMQPAQLRNFDLADVGTVIVGYLNPESVAHARYLVRRLRRQKKALSVVLVMWGLERKEDAGKLAEATGADAIVTTTRELVLLLEPLATREHADRNALHEAEYARSLAAAAVPAG
jgi:predicted PurR-regulated permease PerM